jgi:hypothetical protein
MNSDPKLFLEAVSGRRGVEKLRRCGGEVPRDIVRLVSHAWLSRELGASAAASRPYFNLLTWTARQARATCRLR